MAEIEFPPGTPDEVKEFIRKQIDRQEMSVEMQQHGLNRFFEELSEDQSKQLLFLLRIFETDPSRVAYFHGFLLANIQAKFGICSACGTNHTEQIEHMAAGNDISSDKSITVLRIALGQDEEDD